PSPGVSDQALERRDPVLVFLHQLGRAPVSSFATQMRIRCRDTPCEPAVDGIAAKRSAAATRSSPEATQRCAGGAGLDGGDPDRSNIDNAADRPSNATNLAQSTDAHATPGIYTSL